MAAGTPYAKKTTGKFTTGVDAIPAFRADTTDRNRTSPFAFTGNKFEFRMLGSAVNIACPNVMINTSVADVLKEFADKLEASKNFEADVKKLIVDTYTAHKRIVFNGNNYSDEWSDEAAKRGLLNLKTTPEALAMYDRPENIAMFERHKIYTAAEIKAREEILLENYAKVINIEALAMAQIVSKQIIPAAVAYSATLADSAVKKKALGVDAVAETALAAKITGLTDAAYASLNKLNDAIVAARDVVGALDAAKNYHDSVFMAMQELRLSCDELETVVAREYWPFPTYGDLMYY